MAYPIGSGSERLQRGAMHALVSTATSFKFDGTFPATGTSTYAVPANHLITVLSIFWNNQTTTPTYFVLYVNPLGSSDEYKIIQRQYVGSRATFVWDEKIVLHPTDKLVTYCPSQGSANIDVYYTYVDQDWS